MSLSLSQSLQKLSKLSQCHSLKLTHSPLLAWLILNVPTIETWRHQPISRRKSPISLRPTLPIGVLACGYWVPDRETHGARRPTPSTNPACWRYACLWLVILFGLGWGKRLEIWCFFFFFPHCGLVVVVAVVDGRGGCGWCCGYFLGNGIYYFIVVVKGVHGLVRVEFMPNPQLTRLHWVANWTTRRRP